MINIEDYKDMSAEEMAAAIMTVHAGNCCQAVTAALIQRMPNMRSMASNRASVSGPNFARLRRTRSRDFS